MGSYADDRRTRDWIVVCGLCKRCIGIDFASNKVKDLPLEYVTYEDWDNEKTRGVRTAVDNHESMHRNHRKETSIWLSLDQKTSKKDNPLLKIKVRN